MDTEQVKEYKNFRRAQMGGIVGQNALSCWDSAKVLVRFRKLEEAGKVRIGTQVEHEDYFSIYGEPETFKERKEIERQIELHGCYYVISQYRCPKCGGWKTVDGVGMCIYDNPTSPFENSHVIGMMAEAISATEGV